MHAPKTHIEGRGVICKNCGMITSGMPASLNLSLVAGKEHVYEFEVRQTEGVETDMRFCTFSGKVRNNKGEEQELSVSLQEGTQNVILAVIPALEEGEYDWVLSCTYDNGTSDVLISGILGVFWSNLRISEQVVESPNRRCVFLWNGENVTAQWKKSNYIGQALKEADDLLKEVRGGVQIVQGFIALFDNKFSSAVYIDPKTGNLIIGGKDSGVKVPGENGKSPYVDAMGHWQYWDDKAGKWVDGGPALGRDGRDGTSVKRHLVSRFEDIPQSGDTCNGGHLYYVPAMNDSYVALAGETVKVKLIGVYDGTDGTDLVFNGVRVECREYGERWKEELVYSINQQYSPITNTDYSVYAGWYPEVFAWNGRLLDDDTLELTAVRSGALVEVAAGSEHFALEGGRYFVYAWVEGEGWVRVDEKQDVASESVYGLMKYGTDSIFKSYVPVGKNEDGGACIPVASQNDAGASKVSGVVKDMQAPVYITEDGKLTMEYGKGAMLVQQSSDVDVLVDAIRQDEGKPKVLAASVNVAGVARIADELNDSSDCAASTKCVAAATNVLSRNIAETYATKEDSYKKDEVYPKEKLYTRNEVDDKVRDAIAATKHVSSPDGDVKNLRKISAADFSSVIRDPNTIYFVLR